MRFILYYFAFVNAWLFLLYGYDKWQATHRGRRIPENTLHIWAFIGGSLGALIGQRVFRHKTIKKSFQFMYWLIIGLQLLILIYVLNVLNG